MDIRLPIRWRHLWRILATFIFGVIFALILFFFILVTITGGSAELFRHLTLSVIVIGILAIAVFSCACSLIAALVTSLMSIRLTDNFLEGRNFWGGKEKIPLSDITSISTADLRGPYTIFVPNWIINLTAIVVSSAHHGTIYISPYTENFTELVTLLGTYLPDGTPMPFKAGK